MVTDAAVMAVVRAARPALHGAHDGVAFAAHAAFLAAGYSLCAVGPAALADPSPSGDEEVGIDGWNSMENCYAFLYSKEEKGKKKKVLVKCLVIGEVLAIDVLDLEAQDKAPYIIQINVKDFFVEEQPKNYGEMYKNFASLIETVNSNVLCKLDGDDAGVEATKSIAAKNYDVERSSSIQSSEGRGPRTVDPSRQMDNSWRFIPGFSDMQQGPNMPWMKMLQMPVQVEGAAPGAQTDSVPHDGTDEAAASQRTKSSQKAKQINFSVDEDRILVSCWLNVNLDPITAVGQRKASFWKTIERNYNAQKALSHPVRTLRSLEGRWADIKEQANKFESHYNLVLHENHSGYNDMNKVTAAIALYNSIERKPFTKIHCWEILRNEPKWLDLQKKPGQPQSGCGSGAPIDLTDSAAPEEDSESQNRPSKRPIGRDETKSAKRAAFDTSGSQSSSEHTSFLPNLHIQKLELYKNTQGVVASEIEKLVSVQEKAYKHEQIMANQLLELKKKKWEAHVAKEEERIMSIDLTTLNPAQRTYYETKQRLILERLTRGIDE